ncbi:cyanophycinase [Stenomitos frigidus ULC18]|uniref:Cyanophycinase n=2 Tax=Stenomitos TaxID=1844270 RepID=A0A2T1ET39_9CYAN|nr:cyanophycinase [Stenomitos frigidus ULC18]
MNKRSVYTSVMKLWERLFPIASGVTTSQIEFQSLGENMPQSTKTAIMVIGGAEDKVHGREILHSFFGRSGSADARIAIIPSASREPAIIGDRYLTIFGEMGAKGIEILDIRDREQCEDPLMQSYVENCTGVFMTGGDQLRLCGLLADTPLMKTVRERAQKGAITLAGTSAGAAVMGHYMIAGGGSGESPNRSLVDMTTGLGIIPGVIVDQHFHNRNRMARLMSAIAAYPDRMGIGIDEDTCAVFEGDGTLQVIGKGTVTVLDPAELCYTNQTKVGATDPLSIGNLRLHILSHSDRYDLHKRVPIFSGCGIA